MRSCWFCLFFFLFLFSACKPQAALPPDVEDPAVSTLSLTSKAFGEGDAIPVQHSCDGGDISPSLVWTEPPAGTQSFALIMDDPDAPSGDWVHWVLYNIPADVRTLAENTPPDAALADGSLHGANSWKTYGYGGPCPPSGTHRYFFKLYALDVVLDVEPGLNKHALLDAMQRHILAVGQLMGIFTR